MERLLMVATAVALAILGPNVAITTPDAVQSPQIEAGSTLNVEGSLVPATGDIRLDEGLLACKRKCASDDDIFASWEAKVVDADADRSAGLHRKVLQEGAGSWIRLSFWPGEKVAQELASSAAPKSSMLPS